MSNETKRDVFNDLVEEIANVYIALYSEGIGEYLTNEEKQAYLKDYDAALPDDLPVIPKAVGEWIKDAKARCYDMLEAMTKWTLDQPVFDWIHDNSDTFARAWFDGVWHIEETGEIVKLEAEK